jgi:uncharacterized protein YecE (DUF72 family)
MSEQLSLFSTSEPGERRLPDRVRVMPAPPAEELIQAARVLPSGIFLGTSSWSFPTWSGLVYADTYDQTTLAREGLEAYAQHPLLRSVGIDRTFYTPIPAAEFAHYARQVPGGFRFLVKAPAQCVSPWLRGDHNGRASANPRYLDPEFAAERFVQPATEGLGDRAGPLVFQFPPMGRVSVSQSATFAERLRDFLTRLPSGPLYAVEVRDPALLTDDYLEALRDSGARHCLGLHPRQPGVREQARLLNQLAPGTLVVRWNLHADYGYEEAREHYHPFTRLVDEDLPTRVALARLCLETVAAGHAAFVIANNKAEGSAPLTLFKLAALMAEEVSLRLPARDTGDWQR